jgi:hypothetical protein
MKAFLLFLVSLYCTVSSAEEYPISLACAGTGTSGPTNLTLIIKTWFAGEAVLEGVPLYIQNRMDSPETVFSLIGWPKSQDTGNYKDIKNKVEITVNRFNGSFDLKVSNTFGGGVTGRAQGTCALMTEKKF